jgi:hypothetical protein
LGKEAMPYVVAVNVSGILCGPLEVPACGMGSICAIRRGIWVLFLMSSEARKENSEVGLPEQLEQLDGRQLYGLIKAKKIAVEVLHPRDIVHIPACWWPFFMLMSSPSESGSILHLPIPFETRMRHCEWTIQRTAHDVRHAASVKGLASLARLIG